MALVDLRVCACPTRSGLSAIRVVCSGQRRGTRRNMLRIDPRAGKLREVFMMYCQILIHNPQKYDSPLPKCTIYPSQVPLPDRACFRDFALGASQQGAGTATAKTQTTAARICRNAAVPLFFACLTLPCMWVMDLARVCACALPSCACALGLAWRGACIYTK